ncbi:carboxylate-amine ligase [Thermomonospora umbrina]|uniref:Putative glutamate--cysteine ligase 2 n=1 Tax=Thermomonospora umbrina TaxID=111806 RepID=A0A3D9SIX2_9ACTN|nr:glutamate--cysteine ligase [Thermomonospora umbrina]REE95856.1 YbdK family carboxylate-amine ligase [Thermomonospora umbrina]
MTAVIEDVAVGVEEEFHVVDPRTGLLVPKAEVFLEQLPRDRYGAELQGSVVEANSLPWLRLEDLARDLSAARRRLTKVADVAGLGIVATGSVPLVDLAALEISPVPRYEQMLDEYQLLAREQLICGVQVHVDVGDRDLAAIVLHRLAPWLPVFLAMSASSPFWLGADTGYASSRTLAWQRWPTAGPPGPFGSAAEYDRLVRALVGTGVISDQGMIYFDIRPSAHLPTLELRICDACPRVDDVVLLAGLSRALVIAECRAAEAGEPLPASARTELVRAATWRAARSGLEGELVDPADGRPAPAPRVVEGLLRRLRPVLESLGDWELVAELAAGALRRGGAAARQRSAFAPRGSLTDVVTSLIAETRLEFNEPR